MTSNLSVTYTCGCVLPSVCSECGFPTSTSTKNIPSNPVPATRVKNSIITSTKDQPGPFTHKLRPRSEVGTVCVAGATLSSLILSLKTLDACKKSRGWFVDGCNMEESTPGKLVPQWLDNGLKQTGILFEEGMVTARTHGICIDCGDIVKAAAKRSETMISALKAPYVGCATAANVIELGRILARCRCDHGVDPVADAAAKINNKVPKQPASVKPFISYLGGQDAWEAASTSVNTLVGWRVNACFGGYVSDSLALGITMSSIIDVHLDSLSDRMMVDYAAPLRDDTGRREYGALIDYHHAFVEISLWRSHIQKLTADTVRSIGDIPAYTFFGDDATLRLVELVGVTEHGAGTTAGLRNAIYVPWIIDLADGVFMNSITDMGQEVDLHELGVFSYDLGPHNRRAICRRISAQVAAATQAGDIRYPGLIVANYMYSIVDERHNYRKRLTDALRSYIEASKQLSGAASLTVVQPSRQGPNSKACCELVDAVRNYVSDNWLHGKNPNIVAEITQAFISRFYDQTLPDLPTGQLVEPIVVEAIATHAILPVLCAYGLLEEQKYDEVGVLTEQPLLYKACLADDVEAISKVGSWVWYAVSHAWFGAFAYQDYASGIVIAPEWDCGFEVQTLPGLMHEKV